MIRVHSLNQTDNRIHRISLQKKSEILLAAVIIARSTSLVFSRIAMNSFSPFNLLSLRFIAAFIILCMIFFRKIPAIRLQEIKYGMILGALFTGVLAFELFGLRLTDSGTTSFIENSAMIFVPILQLVFFGRSTSSDSKWKNLISDALRILPALSGIAILSLSGSGGLLRPGSLFLLGAAILYASAIIATSRFSRNSDPLLLGIVQVGTVGILSLILSFIFEQPHLPENGGEWGMILALAVICTGFGFTLQPMAQRGTTAERAGMMCAISPLSATVLGIVFLGEQLSVSKAVGCALIMLSLIMEPAIKHFASVLKNR